MDLKKYALVIVSDLINKLKKSKIIYSCTPLGTNLKTRKFHKTEDIDICLIIEGRMTVKKLKTINLIFNSMKQYSTEDIDVLFSLKDGPMKPTSNKEKIIFLHSPVHTVQSYRQAPEILRYSWQFKEPYFGKKLIEIGPVRKITKEILLNQPLGLKDLLILCKDKKTAYFEWNCDRGCKLHRITSKLKGKELIEIYFYSILRGANNYLKYIEGRKIREIGIQTKMVDEFSKLNIDISNIPRHVLLEKKKLRQNCVRIDDKYIEKKYELTVSFLNKLIEVVD